MVFCRPRAAPDGVTSSSSPTPIRPDIDLYNVSHSAREHSKMEIDLKNGFFSFIYCEGSFGRCLDHAVENMKKAYLPK